MTAPGGSRLEAADADVTSIDAGLLQHGKGASMPQVLRRLDGDLYVIRDDELLIVCGGTTNYHHAVLIGTAFQTRRSGWRCLRLGMIDIGYRPTPEMAIDRIMEDWARTGAPTLDEATRKALPT